MTSRKIALTLLAVGLAGLPACGGGNATSPLSTPTPDGDAPVPQSLPPTPSAPYGSVVSLGGVAATGDVLTSALGLYTIQVDPAALSATVESTQIRQGAANDDLYLLSIDSFLKPDSLQITSVSATPTTLDLTYRVTHPFAAPSDLDAAPTASNRADLGISGMVLFATDVLDAAGNTYFDETGSGGGPVIANTAVVVNADAYYTPAGLISSSGIANTFPYKLLVDDRGATGTRVGISNGGVPTGNYGPDGWTRANIGATNDQWTGYGFLHQGQTSESVLSLDRATLGAGSPFRFEAAIIAKYQDPRGGANGPERKGNRLPPVTADTTKFAYRGNHAALDVERIEFAGDSGGFFTNEISGSTMGFKLVDWDARATETTLTDLSTDPDVSHVAIGEAGLPALSVSIPGVLGDATVIEVFDSSTDVLDDDSSVGGDAGQDSGVPGDELYYERLVTKIPISGQTDGTYVGMVRATDVEVVLTPSLVTPLDGTLVPLTSNLPRPESFQVFTVDMITPNAAPSLTLANPAAIVVSGTDSAVFDVTAYSDADGDQVQIQFDWNDDADYGDTGEALQNVTGATPVSFASPSTYNNATLTNEVRTVPYRYTDGVIAVPITGTGSFTLGPNRAPIVSGSISLQTASIVEPATFTLATSGGFSATDPEGDAITYTVTADANNNGSVEQTASSIAGLSGYNAAPVMGTWNAPQSPVRFRGYANDALHPGTTTATITSTPATLLGTVSILNVPPSVTVGNPAGTVASGNGVATFQVTAYSDGNGDPIQIQFNWNNDPDFSDPGEGLQTISGATPVNFPSPIFYNNTTLVNSTRSVPFQYTDGIIGAPLTGTGTFTLGPNQSPTVSGTFGLATASLPEPATFALSTSGGFTVTDAEGDAIAFTVTADANNNGSVEQTASGVLSLSGYTASPVMGSWTAANSQIRFRAYANDALHAAAAGTAVTSTPATLLGTVTACTPPTMAAVNTTLATLTTGSVVRGGVAANQIITGVRVGWTDVTGEAEYAVLRGTWNDGTTVASVVFNVIATPAINATSYDDLSVSPQGSRYLYRVLARCSVGGTNGAPSQLAMVAMQDFESTSASANLLTGTPLNNGWTVNYSSSATQVATISTGANALNGSRTAEFAELNSGGGLTTQAIVLSPPQLNDRANLGAIGVSRFELVHAAAGTLNANGGYAILGNTARFANNLAGPQTPNNWRWVNTGLSGAAYNDNANLAMTLGQFTNISGQVSGNWNWGASATAETFTAVDAAIATITNTQDFIFAAAASTGNAPDENIRLDDVAWIVY